MAYVGTLDRSSDSNIGLYNGATRRLRGALSLQGQGLRSHGFESPSHLLLPLSPVRSQEPRHRPSCGRFLLSHLPHRWHSAKLSVKTVSWEVPPWLVRPHTAHNYTIYSDTRLLVGSQKPTLGRMGDIEHNLCNAGSGTLQTPLLESSPAYREVCPGCRLQQRKALSRNALPYRDLSIIALLCLCNSLPISSLFAYVYYMVRDLQIAQSTTQIGTYVGFLGSSLLLGRFMGSTGWGIVADRYGHKPVMYIGASSTFIFMTIFGFSTNYWIALVSRFLTGLANGMTATIRAYAAEICSAEYQAFALSIVGTMWGVGLIIGPALGGYLAQPSEKLPLIFPSGSLFDIYPYALPSLCIAILALAAFIFSFWLPESLHTHNISERKMKKEICSHEKNSNIISKTEEGEEPKSKGKVHGGEKQLWKNRAFMASVSLNAVWVVHAMAYSEIFPLWASSPEVYGGLAFTTSEVANVLALSGFVMLLFQLFVFPRLTKAFGTIQCMRAFMFFTVPLTAIYPLVARLHGIVLWILLILVAVVKNVLSTANFTGTFILVNNSVVKAQRGIANGLSTSIMSFFQAIGPACAGALFSWSEGRLDASFLPGVWMVFSVLSGLSFIAFLTTFEPMVPSSLNYPLIDESDTEGDQI